MLLGLCLCYVLMQTFAIPGTLTLSLLSGALYGVKRGWLLVAGAPAASTLFGCLHPRFGRAGLGCLWEGKGYEWRRACVDGKCASRQTRHKCSGGMLPAWSTDGVFQGTLGPHYLHCKQWSRRLLAGVPSCREGYELVGPK